MCLGNRLVIHSNFPRSRANVLYLLRHRSAAARRSVSAQQLRRCIDFLVIATVSFSLALPCVNGRDSGLTLAACDMCKAMKKEVGQGRSLSTSCSPRGNISGICACTFSTASLINHWLYSSNTDHLTSYSSALTDNLRSDD